MALSQVGIGTITFGATDAVAGSVTPTTGDHAFIAVANKLPSTTPTTPTNWTRLLTAVVGTGADGDSQGQVRVGLYYREVPSSGWSIPSFNTSGTGSVIGAVLGVWRVGAGELLDYATALVDYATSGTSFGGAASTNPGITAGDLLAAFSGVGDNPTFSSGSITAPSATIGTTTEVRDSAIGTGNDLGMAVHTATCTAGTASGAPSFTATLSGAAAGGTVLLRATTATQTVSPTSIASAEAFGTPTLTAGPVTVSPTSIPTAEAFGTPQLNFTIYPVGIASAEAFGTPTVAVGSLISPVGIPSAEAFGTPTVTPGPVTIFPAGIASAEAFGTPSVANVISPTGIPSAEAFGTPVVTAGAVTIVVTGIPSAEAFGTPTLNAGAVTLSPTGIPSAEAFGTPSVSMRIYVTGIASAEAFGVPTLTAGPVTISPAGIASGEAFGTPTFNVTIDLARLAGLVDTVQTGYELLCIARIPKVSGPPALLTVDRIKWSSLRYADVLGRPQELSATVRVDSISDVVAQRLLGPERQATELRLLRDGQVVAAGGLAGWHRRGADVELVASGLLGYLRRMIVLADLRFDQVDQHLIAAALVDQFQSSAYGNAHYGIDTSQIGPSGVLRDRSYVRDEQHKISQRVEELGAVDGGFDAEVDPTTRQLQLWHPFKGVDRSTGPSAVVFDHRVIASQDVSCSVEPDDLASLAFGTSSAAGSDTSLAAFAVNDELAASYGLSAVMGSWQDISEQTTLDGHVRALLLARGQALIVPGPQMRVTPDADLGAYDVGDTVQLELGTDQLGITGPYRIRKRVVSVAATGVETVDLELV